MPGKAGKSFVPQAGLPDKVKTVLADIHTSLLSQAEQFQNANIREVDTYAELKEAVEDGFALAPVVDDPKVDAQIKDETKATNRIFPLQQAEGEWKCILTGRPVRERALFGKAY